MLDTINTRIVFMGGACSSAAIETVGALADAGFDIVAVDCDPLENSVFMGGDIAVSKSRSEALSNVDVVLTCCAHPEDVEELYLGDNGLLELVQPETFLVDLSLIPPSMARELKAMASVNGQCYIEAPLINMGEKEATVCFLSGDQEALDTIGVITPYLATTVHRLEKPGEGMLSACLAVIGLAGSLMGAVEAMAVAKICGLGTRDALNALASTGAASRALVDYVPQVINGDFNGRFAVYELLNMLDTALLVSEEMQVTLPMVETAYQLYDLLSVVGGAELNIQALALLYEDEKTCAKHGLDWALADEVDDHRFTGGAPADDCGNEQLDRRLRDIYSSLETQLSATGSIGTGDADLDDYRNHHVRTDDSGDDDFPLAGQFFSKN